MAPERRFKGRRSKPYPRLDPNHPAAVGGRTIHTGMIRKAVPSEEVLKRGEHSRKLGSHFMKRPWMWMPIYSMSLEERRNCPRTCGLWHECYGNGMARAVRWEVDDGLYKELELQLEQLGLSFPRGFAIRLHTLGDFPDMQYLDFWLDALRRHPALHTFGFTAHARNSPIGAAIEAESAKWDRFRIRFSSDLGVRGAIVMEDPPRGRGPQGITCPADSEHPEISCGSCALCLTTTMPIVFRRH